MTHVIAASQNEPSIILLTFLFGFGLFMFLRPSLWWDLTQSWKTQGDAKPSGIWIFVTRLGAAFILILSGVAVLAKLWDFLVKLWNFLVEL